MAILGKSFDSMFTDDVTFTSWEYAIGGKMVVGRAEMSEDFHRMLEDGDKTAIMQVKEKLTRDLVHHMLENKLVEFTHHDDPITSRRQLAIRAYLAPNDQVRILRLANKI
jgi:hypothetical protein